MGLHLVGQEPVFLAELGLLYGMTTGWESNKKLKRQSHSFPPEKRYRDLKSLPLAHVLVSQSSHINSFPQIHSLPHPQAFRYHVLPSLSSYPSFIIFFVLLILTALLKKITWMGRWAGSAGKACDS